LCYPTKVPILLRFCQRLPQLCYISTVKNPVKIIHKETLYSGLKSMIFKCLTVFDFSLFFAPPIFAA
jgi:hypothetical protein